MVLLAGTLATLAIAVQVSNEHHQGNGLAMQHGRVALERIQRSINEATANEQFPGFAVFSESLSGWSYPDTLVVWLPETTPFDPDGLPRMNELVVFCTNVSAPDELLEIRVPSDSRPAPPLSSPGQWALELSALKTDPGADRAVLTDLIRTATATDGGGNSLGTRGCIRFDSRLRPSATQWSQYQGGSRAWEDLAWVQNIYGANTGLRQAWCRIELQLRAADIENHDVRSAIPFFGSASVYYELHR